MGRTLAPHFSKQQHGPKIRALLGRRKTQWHDCRHVASLNTKKMQIRCLFGKQAFVCVCTFLYFLYVPMWHNTAVTLNIFINHFCKHVSSAKVRKNIDFPFAHFWPLVDVLHLYLCVTQSNYYFESLKALTAKCIFKILI